MLSVQFPNTICTMLNKRGESGHPCLVPHLKGNTCFLPTECDVHHFFFSFYNFFNLLILERERETSICCSTYLCIHWLILVCTLTRDRTHNLDAWGQCSNQLSYMARAAIFYFWCSSWPIFGSCVLLTYCFSLWKLHAFFLRTLSSFWWRSFVWELRMLINIVSSLFLGSFIINDKILKIMSSYL